ncbi:hypothetical protein ADL21_05370 [Streptomyces albus subsp. albus]|nr:hypothetical protein ADL21_05370 [Streptomyces albus subsp. albus]
MAVRRCVGVMITSREPDRPSVGHGLARGTQTSGRTDTVIASARPLERVTVKPRRAPVAG